MLIYVIYLFLYFGYANVSVWTYSSSAVKFQTHKIQF